MGILSHEGIVEIIVDTLGEERDYSLGNSQGMQCRSCGALFAEVYDFRGNVDGLVPVCDCNNR
jgi:hypothetical protein